MSPALLLPGVFVVGLVVGLVLRRGHGWLVAAGAAAALVLWLFGSDRDYFDGLEGGSGVAALVLALLFGAWAVGIGAGYLVRRVPPGSL